MTEPAHPPCEQLLLPFMVSRPRKWVPLAVFGSGFKSQQRSTIYRSLGLSALRKIGSATTE
jgi:hypothetical protein